MKFQNPSLNFFMNGWTQARTHGRKDKPKPICSPLFQSWGHKKKNARKRKHLVQIVLLHS